MADDQEVVRFETQPDIEYPVSQKIMLSAIVVLFSFVILMVGLHLYAKWYLVRLRRSQVERRRHFRMNRTQIVESADRGPASSIVESGLERTVLDSLPLFLYTPKAVEPQQECAVCLSEFEEKEIVRLLPKCNHSFHIECIDMWFHSHSTCPLCRSPVERVVGRDEPVVEPNGIASEPGSSVEAGRCTACLNERESSGASTTSLEGPRKVAGIEVATTRTELENELSQSSASQVLSFKGILSMGRRSPVAAGAGAGSATLLGANEVDLESGIIESNRGPSQNQTPM